MRLIHPHVIALGLCCALAQRAHAQPAPAAGPAASPAATSWPLPAAPSAPSAEDQKRAKAVFDAGGRSFEQGDFAAAIQAFEQAYALSGRPSVIFSLAQAHKKAFVDTGTAYHRDAATSLFRAYLAEVKKGGRRADAIKALESLGVAATPSGPAPGPAPAAVVEKKTQLAIELLTPGATLSLDGGPAMTPQGMIEVAPGRHTIKVSAPGFREKEFVTQALPNQITPETYELEELPAKVALELPSGAMVFLDGRDMGGSSQLSLPSGSHFISVAQNGYRSLGQPVELAPGEAKQLSFELESTTQRDLSLGLMIGGGVAIAAGGGLVGVALLREGAASDIEATRAERTITAAEIDEYNQAREDRDNFRLAGGIAGGVGAASLLVGAVLFLSDSSAPLAPPQVGPQPGKPSKPKSGPSEMEEMSFTPWVGPLGSEHVRAGGTWSLTF